MKKTEKCHKKSPEIRKRWGIQAAREPEESIQ